MDSRPAGFLAAAQPFERGNPERETAGRSASLPTMMVWRSVSTQTASSASTWESNSQTSRAWVTSMAAHPRATGLVPASGCKGSPSTHSVAMKGMPSTGSQPPQMTDRSAGCLSPDEAVDRDVCRRSALRRADRRHPRRRERTGARPPVLPVSVSSARNTTPDASWTIRSSILKRRITGWVYIRNSGTRKAAIAERRNCRVIREAERIDPRRIVPADGIPARLRRGPRR